MKYAHAYINIYGFTNICIYVYMFLQYMCICVCKIMYVSTYARICWHIHLRTQIHIYCKNMYTYIHIYICLQYVCIFMCKSMYVSTYAYTCRAYKK